MKKMSLESFGKKKNKRAMSMSVIALVLLTIILVVLTLTYFITSKKVDVQILHAPTELDLAYNQAESFNFYLNNIFDNTRSYFNVNEGTSKFAEEFNKELAKSKFYSICDIKYSPIEGKNVQISEGKTILNVDVDISCGSDTDKGKTKVRYSYKKTFS